MKLTKFATALLIAGMGVSFAASAKVTVFAAEMCIRDRFLLSKGRYFVRYLLFKPTRNSKGYFSFAVGKLTST